MSESERASAKRQRTTSTVSESERASAKRQRTSSRIRWRAIVAVLATTIALALPTYAAADPAPDPLVSAQSQASALRARLDSLQIQSEIATERYNAVSEQLGAATSRVLSAQAWADALRGVRSSGTETAISRARALYMGGGSLALYASVLDGSDLGDVLSRVESVRTLIGADASRIRAEDRIVADAGEQLNRLAAAESTAGLLRAQADAAGTQVRELLAEQTRLTDQADAEVTRIVAAQRAAQEAEAAARTRAALAALRSTTDLPPAPSVLAARAIEAARTRLGVPYVWGATGPDTFDCSGLTGWAYRQAGIQIPRIAQDQWFAGPHVALSDLAPGDLVFWATDTMQPSTIYHVAFYLGGGLTLQAPRTGDVVKITPLRLEKYIGAVRVVPAGSTAGALPPANMR